MNNDINLKTINEKYADNLVEIINTDEELNNALGSNGKITNRDEFISTIQQWQIKNNSKTFAIVLSDKAIGTISLSHIKEENHSAQIGYWIGSNFWNKGYTTQAFAHILDLARELKIEFLNASIKKDNIASKLIWQRFGAEFGEDNERIYPRINL